MRIVLGLESYPPDADPGVVALGVFDGIHLGHRAILATAVERARERGLRSLVCTFDPHPRQVLQPDRAPLPITTLAERLDLIAGTGIDATVVVAFTPEIAVVDPEVFVTEILLGRLKAAEVVVGFNHTFGRGARGSPRLLETLAARLGFTARVVPPLRVDGVAVSSSEVRAALRKGDLARSARFLGRPYAVDGRVVAGAGRGRTLGFPTANLATTRPLLVPLGVYACRAALDGVAHPAVVNVGVRPTFGEERVTVEAHLLDGAGELYGRRVHLEFVARLRDERKFPDVEALRRQIDQDVRAARQTLG